MFDMGWAEVTIRGKIALQEPLGRLSKRDHASGWRSGHRAPFFVAF